MATLLMDDSTSHAKSEVNKDVIKEEKIERFFEKKALEAKIFLRNNPIPEELLKRKSDQSE